MSDTERCNCGNAWEFHMPMIPAPHGPYPNMVSCSKCGRVETFGGKVLRKKWPVEDKETRK